MSRVSMISGKRLDLLKPHEADIDIHDIAHGLSMICRYGGQTSQFYSVAQHCSILSVVVPPLVLQQYPQTTEWELKEIAKTALLHDAAEAYTGDIKTPLKNLMPDFVERIEAPLELVIFKRFNLSTDWMRIIHAYDKRIVVNEMKRLFFTGVPIELIGVEPIPNVVITPQSPEEARRWFYARYKTLFSGDERELKHA
jgi:5'-deoxynucleotidase YfbR-like HD superfamily hydrolase